MIYKLFLDDLRNPSECISYIDNVVYLEKDWVIVKTYNEFTKIIEDKGIPDIISFDHDLDNSHYKIPLDNWLKFTSKEMNLPETGYDCMLWLVKYCKQFHLDIPKCLIHTMNVAGHMKMNALLEVFKNTSNI